MKAFSFIPFFLVITWLGSGFHFSTVNEHEWTDKVSPKLLDTENPEKRQDIIIYLDAQADVSLADQLKTKARERGICVSSTSRFHPPTPI